MAQISCLITWRCVVSVSFILNCSILCTMSKRSNRSMLAGKWMFVGLKDWSIALLCWANVCSLFTTKQLCWKPEFICSDELCSAACPVAQQMSVVCFPESKGAILLDAWSCMPCCIMCSCLHEHRRSRSWIFACTSYGSRMTHTFSTGTETLWWQHKLLKYMSEIESRANANTKL